MKEKSVAAFSPPLSFFTTFVTLSVPFLSLLVMTHDVTSLASTGKVSPLVTSTAVAPAGVQTMDDTS